MGTPSAEGARIEVPRGKDEAPQAPRVWGVGRGAPLPTAGGAEEGALPRKKLILALKFWCILDCIFYSSATFLHAKPEFNHCRHIEAVKVSR